MRNITLRGEQVETLDNWDEIVIGDYVKLVDLYSQLSNMIEEEFLIKFISILTKLDETYLFDLYEEDLLEVTNLINNFSLDELVKKDCKRIDMNNRIYSYVSPNKLTVGEKISIKLLEETSKTNGDSWLNLLSILIRPALEKVDELGHTYYEVEKFNGDIELLNGRKQLIAENVKAVNALYIIEAFMPGNG